MAISLVSGGAVSGTAIDADVTLTLPTLAQNDVVIVFGGHGHAVGADTVPTGYTEAITPHEGATIDTTPDFGVSYKVMGAVPDTSVVCPGVSHTGIVNAYGAYCLRGVDTSTVLDQTPVTAGETTSTNPNCASITTLTNGAWVLALALSMTNDTAVTLPSGYSNLINAGDAADDSASILGATKEVSVAGAENPAAFGSVNSGIWFAVTLAIRQASAARLPSPLFARQAIQRAAFY